MLGEVSKTQFLSLSAMSPILLAARWRTRKLKNVASIPTPINQYSNSDKNVKIVNNFPAVVRGARSPYQTVAKVTTLK